MTYNEFQTDNHKVMGLIATHERLTAHTEIGGAKITLIQDTHGDLVETTREPYSGVAFPVDVTVYIEAGRDKLKITSLTKYPVVFKYTEFGTWRKQTKGEYIKWVAEVLNYYDSEQCQLDFARNEIRESTVEIDRLEAEIELLRKHRAKYETFVIESLDKPPPCKHDIVYDPILGELGCRICGMPVGEEAIE